MKFGRVIEYNMRSIFLEKSSPKCGGETIPRLYLWINSLNFHTLYFYCQVENYRNISKLSCRPLAFTISRHFKKQKQVWNFSSYLIFCIILGEKYLSYYILLHDQISLSDCIYSVRYWAVCVFDYLITRL